MLGIHMRTLGGTSAVRNTLKRWFKRHSRFDKGYVGFCGIYNDGHNLFIQASQAVGEFTTIPLQFFRYCPGFVTVAEMKIIHCGHEYGLNGGKATIMVLSGVFSYRLTILPCHIAHAVNKGWFTVTRTDYLPIQRQFLPLV
jgi:hypothetical protein